MRPLFPIVAAALLLTGAPSAAQLEDAAPDFVMLADAEGDGLVSQDEFIAYYALFWELFAAGKSEVDVDQAAPLLRAAILGVLPRTSGRVGRDRLLDAVSAHYRHADKDEDGIVTMAEMRAWKAIAMTPSPS